jgi:excisionase family DNA binding protein
VDSPDNNEATGTLVVWLSVTDAASRLGKSERTVRRLCSSGEIPCRKAGGSWLIDPSGTDETVDTDQHTKRPNGHQDDRMAANASSVTEDRAVEVTTKELEWFAQAAELEQLKTRNRDLEQQALRAMSLLASKDREIGTLADTISTLSDTIAKLIRDRAISTDLL